MSPSTLRRRRFTHLPLGSGGGAASRPGSQSLSSAAGRPAWRSPGLPSCPLSSDDLRRCPSDTVSELDSERCPVVPGGGWPIPPSWASLTLQLCLSAWRPEQWAGPSVLPPSSQRGCLRGYPCPLAGGSPGSPSSSGPRPQYTGRSRPSSNEEPSLTWGFRPLGHSQEA